MKKTILLGLAIATLLGAGGCTHEKGLDEPSQSKSIVVLYENDVHCGVAGYTKMAGLRDAINQSDTARCVVVSDGDFLQGGTWGALSSGAYIVDLMNAVGYDAVTIGNHEFDYGGPRLLSLMNQLQAPKTCVNFSKYGSTEQIYQPYVMTTVGAKKIAFVGVVTPATLSMEYYSFYDSLGRQTYDLYPGTYIDLTQQAVDKARLAGADYVFVLSHLGEQDADYSSIRLIEGTYGIDEVLDGHTHSVIPDSSAVNKNFEVVHFTQTGTQFANIGKLVIRPDGTMWTELIPTSTIPYSNARVDAVYDSLQTLISQTSDTVLAYTDHIIRIYDEQGNRLVRKQECAAGDLVADAFRYAMGTQIGLVNGGGVRANIDKGDITYGDVVAVNPFFNDLEARELTGAQLRAFLSQAYKSLPQEDGFFAQVSGLKIQISLAGDSVRITDIQVENTAGQYEALDDTRTYTVGSTNYYFETYSNLGGKVITPCILKDVGAVKLYLTKGLKGQIGTKYTTTEGRITIQ